jgi:WD40 repeat protein
MAQNQKIDLSSHKSFEDHNQEHFQKKVPLLRYFANRLSENIKTSLDLHEGLRPTLFSKPGAPIRHLAATTDFRYIYASTDNNMLLKYDLSSKELISETPNIHTDQINFICCSPTYLLTSSVSGEIKQFSIVEGGPDTEFHDLENPHGCKITGLTCTRKSDKIGFSADEKGVLNLYDLDSKKTLEVENLVKGSISSLYLLPNEARLYVGYKGGNCFEFNLAEADYEFQHKLPCDFKSPIVAMTGMKNSQKLFVASADGCLRLFNIVEFNLEKNFGEIHRATIKCLQISRDDAFLFSNDAHGIIRKFSVQQKVLLKSRSAIEEIKKVGDRAADFYNLSGDDAWVMAPGQLISAGANGHICTIPMNDTIYHADLGQVLTYADPEYTETELAGKSDVLARNFIVTDKRDLAKTRMYVIGKNYKQELNLGASTIDKNYTKVIHNSTITACADNETYVFTADKTGELKQWNKDDFSLMTDHTSQIDVKINRMVCTKNNQFLLITNFDGDVYCMDITSQQIVHTYEKLHNSRITAMACSPDGQHLFTASEYGKLRQWVIKDGTIELHKEYKQSKAGHIICLCFTNDGRYIFSGDTSGTIKQFYTKASEEIAAFGSLGKKPITDLEVSDCGKHLYVGTAAGQLKRMSIADQIVVQDFGKIHSSAISSIELSMDCKWLITVDFSGKVLQFDEERFYSGSSTIAATQDYLAPLGVNYFNHTYDLNFLSSILLKNIGKRKITELREFFIENHQEIALRYLNCTMVSNTDIVTMIMAYMVTGQEVRIPTLLKCLKSNDKLPRVDMNGLVCYFAMADWSEGEWFGERLIEGLIGYDFKKCLYFKKGSPELTKKKTIITHDCVEDQNTEKLCKKTFLLPENSTPMLNVDVWKWTVKVNFVTPSDELFLWLKMLMENGHAKRNVIQDKKVMGVVDEIYKQFRLKLYCQLALFLGVFLTIFFQGWSLNIDVGNPFYAQVAV